jgi:hypothetical protein
VSSWNSSKKAERNGRREEYEIERRVRDVRKERRRRRRILSLSL